MLLVLSKDNRNKRKQRRIYKSHTLVKIVNMGKITPGKETSLP